MTEAAGICQEVSDSSETFYSQQCSFHDKARLKLEQLSVDAFKAYEKAYEGAFVLFSHATTSAIPPWVVSLCHFNDGDIQTTFERSREPFAPPKIAGSWELPEDETPLRLFERTTRCGPGAAWWTYSLAITCKTLSKTGLASLWCRRPDPTYPWQEVLYSIIDPDKGIYFHAQEMLYQRLSVVCGSDEEGTDKAAEWVDMPCGCITYYSQTIWPPEDGEEGLLCGEMAALLYTLAEQHKYRRDLYKRGLAVQMAECKARVVSVTMTHIRIVTASFDPDSLKLVFRESFTSPWPEYDERAYTEFADTWKRIAEHTVEPLHQQPELSSLPLRRTRPPATNTANTANTETMDTKTGRSGAESVRQVSGTSSIFDEDLEICQDRRSFSNIDKPVVSDSESGDETD